MSEPERRHHSAEDEDSLLVRHSKRTSTLSTALGTVTLAAVVVSLS